MSEIYRAYQEGKIIKSSEFVTPEGLEAFGGVVWEDHVRDLNTAQSSLFDSEVYWQKLHPIDPPLTPEQEHLKRVEVRNSIV